MASTYIERTPSSTGNQDTFTISFWIKRGNISSDMQIIGQQVSSYFRVMFLASDKFRVYSPDLDLQTNRLFRDNSGWMHICVAIDTTQATSSNRAKIYINGVQETSFSTETYPSQNTDMAFNNQQVHSIGRSSTSGSDNFDGLMSHFQVVDGLALAPTEFGEVDSTSNIWKIKTASYGTPGSNGFHLKMENSANMDLDSSSNAHTFTTGGTLTATKDNPSNNFCTLTNLQHNISGWVINSNGNSTSTWGDATNHVQGTQGIQGGKFYWEVQINENNGYFGVCENGRAFQRAATTNFPFYFVTNGGAATCTVYNNPRSGSNSSTFTGTSHEINDIVMIAYDADNGNLYYGKNGSWENSGDPTSGASATGAVVTGIAIRFGGMIVPFQGSGTASSRTFKYNFGNGYFGDTSHGETNSDSASIGLFKYTVPSGYYALCTKNIKTQGGI